MMVSKRNLLFKGAIFRLYVCFGGCKFRYVYIYILSHDGFTVLNGSFFRSWRLLGASLQVLSGGLGRLLVVMSGSLKGGTVGGTARQPTTVWDAAETL